MALTPKQLALLGNSNGDDVQTTSSRNSGADLMDQLDSRITEFYYSLFAREPTIGENRQVYRLLFKADYVSPRMEQLSDALSMDDGPFTIIIRKSRMGRL